jgi:nicotinate-nucleotide adenylyltransferase
MWSTPALVFLRFSPDLRSATAYRQANPDWHRDYEGKRVIDGVTHKSVY